MNASFSNSLTLPDGFPEVLRDFTREILRDQPNDLCTYGADYFAALAANQNTGAAEEAHPTINMDDLEGRITDMFLANDAEGKGYLTRAQATTVVTNVAGELNFSEAQVAYIMTEADENHDGMIDFNEFLPLMLELVQLLIAKSEVENKLMENEALVEDRLLQGMDSSTLNNLLLSIFQSADQSGTGYLDRNEFQAALKSADLGLTRKEINGLLQAVDENEDGKISYEEFAPVAFDLCVQIYTRQVAHESLPTGEKEIADYFEQLFKSADTNGTGSLLHSELADLLRSSDLGMSRVQLHAVLGSAVKRGDGTVNYVDFATSAATMVGSMLNFEGQAERLKYRSENEALLNGMNEESFKGAMADSFTGSESTMGLDAIQDAIFSVMPQCTTQEMNALLSLLYQQEESNEEDSYLFDDLIEYGFLVLQEQKEAAAMTM